MIALDFRNINSQTIPLPLRNYYLLYCSVYLKLSNELSIQQTSNINIINARIMRVPLIQTLINSNFIKEYPQCAIYLSATSPY